MATKTCTLCGETRHIALFYRRDNKNKRAPECSFCANKRTRQHRKARTLADIRKGLGLPPLQKL